MKKKPVFLIALVVILLIALAAAYYFSSNSDDDGGLDEVKSVVISEDAYNNDTTLTVTNQNDIVLEFTENKKFSKAIDSITIDGGENIVKACEITSSTITIPSSYFQDIKKDSQTFAITVEAGGYDVSKVSQVVYAADTWALIWNDEFDGDTLDLTKWSYQLGDGSQYGIAGWGNDELQGYSEDAVSVDNGLLCIQAENTPDGDYKYSSGRIRTVTDEGESLFTTKYGKIEAKIKLPSGNGLWPAFWMLPESTEIYGIWPMSGEIDIMEARGRLTDTVCGTIHYGQPWPNNRYSGGDYFMPEGKDITQYHTYTLEWMPGQLSWFVDGQLFHTETNWYSRAKGADEDFTYPAPYDQQFYILLNMAVGGKFDEGRVPNAQKDMPAQMLVDYVRVYENVNGYDETNIKPQTERDEEGTAAYIVEDAEYNYIQDSTFSTMNTEAMTTRSMDVNSTNWYFLALVEYGGKAAVTTTEEDGSTFVNVNISNTGSQTYSVQLIQHLPLVKGYVYEISFDAKADAERNMIVKFGGDDDNAWKTYGGAFSEKVTTEVQHYTETFTMMDVTDGTARLELNLGEDTGEISIANLQLKVMNLAVSD